MEMLGLSDITIEGRTRLTHSGDAGIIRYEFENIGNDLGGS